MGNIRLIVFDGDDTLWETQSLYDAAKVQFVAELRRQGLPTEGAKTLLERIDLDNVGHLGFSRERFPHSMVETYRRLCKEIGRDIDPDLQNRLRMVGESVFTAPPKPIASAQEILERLSASHAIALCTIGDQTVQEHRIEQSGLRRYFERMYIVPRKDENAFKGILADFGLPAENACSVGNSLRSDINPAVRIGMHAVWIPHSTWGYEEAENEPASDHIISLHSLQSLPMALESIR